MHRKGKRLCIIGGGGYLGSILAKELMKFGHKVVIFDVRVTNLVPKDAIVVQGDVRSLKDLETALKQCDGAFHLASFGMSGRDMLNRQKIDAINIGGTENVLKACRNCAVPRLVYASTVNVVFGGQEIRNGKEEELPYYPAHKQVDHYSRTKATAERLVLLANRWGDTVLPGEAEERIGELNTCALRFCGIYGPGETRHIPRIACYMERGLFQITYDHGHTSLTQYSSGENCAQALRLAYDALTEEHMYTGRGQAYFIADGEPVDSFEFWLPLGKALIQSFSSPRTENSLALMANLLVCTVYGVIGLGNETD